MDVKLHTLPEIKIKFAKELKNLYDQNEINFLFNIIIKTITGAPGLHVIINKDFRINEEEAGRIFSVIRELKKGKPYQYVLGETSFYGFRIKVNSSVLIPRPETEELVDIIIKENSGFKGDIFDFGTGSGCISIALASGIRESNVTGVDNSDAALELAKENARINKVNVEFIKADIFNFDPRGRKAGIIVSNPPYVRESEKKLMNRNVLDFEPGKALFVTDEKPLVFYEAILHIAARMLNMGGKIYFEINEAMGDQLTTLIPGYGFRDVKVIKDLNGRDRFAKAIKNE